MHIPGRWTGISRQVDKKVETKADQVETKVDNKVCK